MPTSQEMITLALPTWVAVLNFYLSFLREPLYKLLGREPRFVSGLPIVGSLFLAVALCFVERTTSVWAFAAVILIIDTGGIPWLLGALVWQNCKRRNRLK